MCVLMWTRKDFENHEFFNKPKSTMAGVIVTFSYYSVFEVKTPFQITPA